MRDEILLLRIIFSESGYFYFLRSVQRVTTRICSRFVSDDFVLELWYKIYSPFDILWCSSCTKKSHTIYEWKSKKHSVSPWNSSPAQSHEKRKISSLFSPFPWVCFATEILAKPCIFLEFGKRKISYNNRYIAMTS